MGKTHKFLRESVPLYPYLTHFVKEINFYNNKIIDFCISLKNETFKGNGEITSKEWGVVTGNGKNVLI